MKKKLSKFLLSLGQVEFMGRPFPLNDLCWGKRNSERMAIDTGWYGCLAHNDPIPFLRIVESTPLISEMDR